MARNEAPALAFESLACAPAAVSSLAYWIGPCSVAVLPGTGAGAIAASMSYQYDVEEQADRTGVVIPRDADWRDHFTPVAPVQLARAWSPLPAAARALGPPQWTCVETDVMGTKAAVCGWEAANRYEASAIEADTPDQQRFHRLLAVAVMRARDNGRGLLIAAKPGWSYDDVREVSPGTRELMQRAGFVLSDRRPALTEG